MVHCFQNIWFNKRTHPKEYRKGYRLSTKWVLASDQSSVRSWPAIKELSSVAGRCVGRGCALIRQLANKSCASIFLQECPTGVVKEDTFKDIYAHFFPQGGQLKLLTVFCTHKNMCGPMVDSTPLCGPHCNLEILFIRWDF